MERLGRPAVTIVSGRFDGDARATARARGMPGLQYVVVPWIYRNLDLQRTIEQSDGAVDDIVRELTTVRPGGGSATARPAERERFEGWDRYEAFEAMNREFLRRDMGDGFPLLPPTPEAVERLLRGTRLPADHVLCDLPPGDGVATVEKVAANAAMAGADPEHMPIILAMLKALSQADPVGLRPFLTSTSSHASLLLVNGPIAREVGVNGKAACLGPGPQNRANIAVGRAYTLALKNIGMWRPGHLDMDTIGSTRKFTPCIAEHEEASPWEPFHVERGFRAEDSVATVLATKGEVDVMDQGNTTAEGMLKTLAYNAVFGQWDLAMRNSDRPDSAWETIMLLPPDCVRPIAEGGFNKRQAKEYIHHHATYSVRRMAHYQPFTREHIQPQWRWLMDLSEKELDELWLPVRQGPERYQLLCVGADRAKPHIIPSMPIRPSSEPVDPYRPGQEV
jgi:hypothetical protein